MSTRANVVLKESYSYKVENGKMQDVTNELIFYRHSDGYPEGTLPTLNIFMEWLKSNKIRNNLSQSAGWLVVLGAIEYGTIPPYKRQESKFEGAPRYGDLNTIEKPKDNGSKWKVGAYEPTTCIHGDIEWLYTIDVENKTLEYHEV